MRDRRPIGQEKLPVVTEAGQPLGACTIQKFARRPGEPSKVIVFEDADGRPVATLRVYRLHSLIHCGGVDELHIPRRVECKHAVRLAQVALGVKGNDGALMAAVRREAEALQPPPQRPDDRPRWR